jgi:hypothetical protein
MSKPLPSPPGLVNQCRTSDRFEEQPHPVHGHLHGLASFS